MVRRWGLGPVFVLEVLRNARRWQLYALRSLFVFLLLIAFALVWRSEVASQRGATMQTLANAGEYFFYALVGTHLALTLLIAPVATSGAICLEKSRGSLVHLLVTDLSNAEIVLGKLVARMVPIVSSLLCSLPVLFLGIMLGGIDPESIVSAFLVTLGVAVLSCTSALTLSVWGNRTYEVLLLTYLLQAAILLLLPNWILLSGTGLVPAWVEWTNPFWVAFLPYLRPGTRNLQAAWTFLGFTLGISAALTILAVVRLRPVILGQVNRPALVKRFRRLSRILPACPWLPQPSLDGNPVLWRECYCRRASRLGQFAWWIYLLASVFSLLLIGAFGPNRRPDPVEVLIILFQLPIGLLLLSVAASSAWAEERGRGSLDVLLATPLSARTILWGKWLAVYRWVPLLAVWPTLFALSHYIMEIPPWFGFVLMISLILAWGATITSIGVALATWIARPALAVSLAVIAWGLLTFGGYFLVMWEANRNSGVIHGGLACCTPFFGWVASFGGFHRPAAIAALIWCAFWILFYTAMAAVLLFATMAMFDRHLGRKPRAAPPMEKAQAFLRELAEENWGP